LQRHLSLHITTAASIYMPAEFIDTLHDPAVRDLAWVIGSPGLLEASYPAYDGKVVNDAWCSAQLQACNSWLTTLDLSPLALHSFIAARPTRRLGHYFETLIKFWLTHMPDTQIIATNLQVQDKLRTLGEYDFLFRDASTTVCHWEAAVKFYLQLEPMAEQRAFIGPGARDRLDLKLGRVFQHQLTLGHTLAGQSALPPGIKLHKMQAFIKGYLFYHASSVNKISAPGVSAAHLSGWWVRHTVDKIPQASADSHWIILPRLRWLAPAREAEDAKVLSFTALGSHLNKHFSLSSDAVLLFEMTRSTTGAWHEISRGFVVCSSWPDIDGLTFA
jgi:hypothetical protein